MELLSSRSRLAHRHALTVQEGTRPRREMETARLSFVRSSLAHSSSCTSMPQLASMVASFGHMVRSPSSAIWGKLGVGDGVGFRGGGGIREKKLKCCSTRSHQ